MPDINSKSREQEKFSKLIKELRSSRKLTQRKFAKLFKTKITYQCIGQWERGKTIPARKYWNEIAELAEMEPGEFYRYMDIVPISRHSLLEDIRMKMRSLTVSELETVYEIVVERLNSHNYEQSNSKIKLSKTQSLHLARLRQGANFWNNWRMRYPNVIPNLSGINLSQADCQNLSDYNLKFADLSCTVGESISFQDANLNKANLQKAKFNLTNFENANLREADLSNAKFAKVNLRKADFKNANLSDVELVDSDCAEANFTEAFLQRAILKNCNVYGASFWGIKDSNIQLQNTFISSEQTDKVKIPVEKLILAQNIYAEYLNSW